jgi:hypothetical protein
LTSYRLHFVVNNADFWHWNNLKSRVIN